MILDRAWAMYVTRRQVSALSFFGPQGHGSCDPGQIQGVPGLAMVTSLGSVRNAKCWVSSGAIAPSTDFIHAFLPRLGISTTGNIHHREYPWTISDFCTQSGKGRSFICIFRQEPPLVLFLSVSVDGRYTQISLEFS